MISMMHKAMRRPRAGFTLVEIAITMLVFSMAVIAVLGLLPIGMRQGRLSVADTKQSVFAEQMLNILVARSYSMTNSADWASTNEFVKAMANLKLPDGSPVVFNNEKLIESYVVDDPSSIMRYKLEVKKIDGSRPHYRATVWASDQRYNRLDGITPFCVDMVYFGPTP